MFHVYIRISDGLLYFLPLGPEILLRPSAYSFSSAATWNKGKSPLRVAGGRDEGCTHELYAVADGSGADTAERFATSERSSFVYALAPGETANRMVSFHAPASFLKACVTLYNLEYMATAFMSSGEQQQSVLVARSTTKKKPSVAFSPQANYTD
jgi:hypothetical protein